MANSQSKALGLENDVFIDVKALSFEYMNVSRLYLAVGCRSISPLESSSLAFFLLLPRSAGTSCCIGCSRLCLLQYFFVSANTFVKSLHSWRTHPSPFLTNFTAINRTFFSDWRIFEAGSSGKDVLSLWFQRCNLIFKRKDVNVSDRFAALVWLLALL